MQKYTAVIIGAGPAGHSCAVRIAQLGGKVAIVERDYIGGICTNWGCTPSKAMIESAKVAKEVQHSPKYGIETEKVTINFPIVAQRRNQVVVQVRELVTDLLNHHKIDIFQAEAEILQPGQVKITPGKFNHQTGAMDYTGEAQIIETEHIIIATGSKPIIPALFDENDPTIVSSNQLITVDALPETLTIVGGGVIGLEFATIFSNLGSKVTIVELLPRVLAGMDEAISAEITRIMATNGVTLLTNHKVISLQNGIMLAENQLTGQMVELRSKMNLIAIGREAVMNDTAYSKLGLDYTKKGINTNEFMQTNLSGIWAIGDATGKSILAHAGIQQGVVTAENLMNNSGNLRRMDYDIIPAVVYSLPEIVCIGTVPQNLDGIQIVTVPFAVNLRAVIEAHTDGFLKLWIKDGIILAAQAIGHNVSELMQEIVNMIALKTPIADVGKIIHPHPSYAEIIRSTLEHAQGEAVDFYL